MPVHTYVVECKHTVLLIDQVLLRLQSFSCHDGSSAMARQCAALNDGAAGYAALRLDGAPGSVEGAGS